MDENFMPFWTASSARGDLVNIDQPVDIRHVATLVDQSDKALRFNQPIGYDMPIVSGSSARSSAR